MAFFDYIQSDANTPPELPLVHTTEYYRLASIQADHTIGTDFQEPLVYLFYGRPAYRDCSRTTPAWKADDDDKDKSAMIGFYPICFVFSPGSILNNKPARALYPFDTGAAHAGLYKPCIEPCHVDGYSLKPATIENARRVVSCFFGTNENYLSSRPKADLHFSSGEGEASSYCKLINGGGHPDCDDRCSAIEVQVAEKLNLRNGVLTAVVLPSFFLDYPDLHHTILKVWRAQPLPYDGDLGLRPLEFHGAIRHLVRQFYRESSLV